MSTRIRPGYALRLAAASLLVAPALPAAAQQPARNPAVDRIFAEYDKPDSPGCSVGAVQDGRFVYQQGYGMANLDYDIPNSPGMVYYVGSVSKQFTAAVVALLAIDGRIGLDDDVRKYFPEMPAYERPVTVRQLVHHTSGIRDVYTLQGLRGDLMEYMPDEDALALIARQRSTAFTPGSQYSYTNSGYFLLAQLVERVTGRSLREVADEQIFRPLGMTRTHFHDEPGHVMKQRAMSYERAGRDGYRISYLQNFDKIGAGGLYTTLDDLRKWDANFYTKQVGGDALHALMHTRGVLTGGDTLPYAFGINVGERRGLRVVEHGGSLMGYKAYLARYPDQRFSVLLTCNLGAIDPGPLAHAVAEVFLGNRMAPATVAANRPAAQQAGTRPAPAQQTLTAEQAAPLLGTYYSPDLDVTYTVSRGEDGRLVMRTPRRPPLVMTVAADGAFRAGNATVRFDRAGSAPATGMRFTVARIGELRLERQR